MVPQPIPDIIIETCSGGGGRYDLRNDAIGEQIWTSDLTAGSAQVIQYGSTLAYPAATMAATVTHPATIPTRSTTVARSNSRNARIRDEHTYGR